MDQAACERNQAAWNAAVATVGGGHTWEDAGLEWSWQPPETHLLLNFPAVIDADAAARGVADARELGAHVIGAWLNTGVDAAPLEAIGFEEGWEPWWMAARLDDVAPATGDAVRLIAGDDDDCEPAARVLLTDPRVRHARAIVDGRRVGGGWAFVDGGVAGIYDMGVAPAFQRRGLGRGLLRTLCANARDAGARVATLNATPDGEQLYSVEGFRRVGTGITYWHHLR